MSMTPVPAANRYDCNWCVEHIHVNEDERPEYWVALQTGAGAAIRHMCPTCAKKILRPKQDRP